MKCVTNLASAQTIVMMISFLIPYCHNCLVRKRFPASNFFSFPNSFQASWIISLQKWFLSWRGWVSIKTTLKAVTSSFVLLSKFCSRNPSKFDLSIDTKLEATARFSGFTWLLFRAVWGYRGADVRISFLRASQLGIRVLVWVCDYRRISCASPLLSELLTWWRMHEMTTFFEFAQTTGDKDFGHPFWLMRSPLHNSLCFFGGIFGKSLSGSHYDCYRKVHALMRELWGVMLSLPWSVKRKPTFEEKNLNAFIKIEKNWNRSQSSSE